jgi:DNA replication protein DnaC
VKTNGVFVLSDELTKRLPWLTPDNVAFLWDTVRSLQNVLICGPPGIGKTTLLTIIARWYLRASEFDHPKIKAQRESLAQYLLEYEPGDHTTTPCDPDALREVWRARGLRFVTAHNLLTTNQRDVDDDAVESAQRASILLLDEVGEELGSAERGKYLSSSRAPAVTSVIKHRWNAERRFFVTTPYDPNKLDAMYEGGTFRRLVEDASCASVIDLNDEGWAGAFIKERDKTKSRIVKR